MKITIAAVGKLKEDYLKEASAFLSASISKHCEFDIIEIPDEKNEDNASFSVTESIKNKEGAGLMKRIVASQYVIALAIDGDQLNTDGLKNKIMTCRTKGKDDIVFVIGGSLGLSNEVLKRADYKLSFSPMTFPHQLMRIMLMEQISLSLK
ncbi:MAG: 23S rRNA (pseudouridine(1915)-N(3))-methyltransferase RlmH [Clostridiales bacterium]|nr:23S rRNA (pseudouridine(1915)-N(3))-methyltransferase RlmH [Clostridiales bacterium]